MQVEVELRPHKGVQHTPLGPVEVEHDQWMVMARTDWTGSQWLHMGYVGKPSATRPAPPFNGLETFRRLPAQFKDLICWRVRSLIGTQTMRVCEPPPPVVIPDDEE